MLIRSQDNSMLVNFNQISQMDIMKLRKLEGFYYAISTGHGEECYVISAGTCRIAEYSTIEKARKVLDMVETHYALFSKACLLPGCLEIKPVFQMPAEEEVMDDE